MDTLLSHDAKGEEASYSKMAEGGDAADFFSLLPVLIF